MLEKVLAGVLFIGIYAPAQVSAAEEATERPRHLLGVCSTSQLEEEPYAEWYRGGFERYTPHPQVLQALRKADQQGVEMILFFGTWCGDSRREVPRIVKLLEAMGFPAERLVLVGVDGGEGVHKQSPGGEERGLEIYRVPTLVVRRDGKEISRLVEFPVRSLERDLLSILSGAPYEPNYESYPTVRAWLEDGLLADPNVSARGLAACVRHVVSGEGELAAAATVLLERGDTTGAVKLARVNSALYPESARAHERLAEAELASGRPGAAREAAERAMRLNTDPDRVDELVDLLGRIHAEDASE